MSSRIGYPGFVLATGLGWLILLDLSLAGHAGNRYLALYHQGHLWLAMLVLSLLLFARRPVSRGFASLLSVGGETLQRASRRFGARQRRRRCSSLAAAAAVLAFGLGPRPPAPAHVGARPRLADRRRGLVLLPARRPADRAARAQRQGGDVVPALRLADAVRRRRARRRDGRHPRHGPAPDRRLRVGRVPRRGAGDVVAPPQRPGRQRVRARRSSSSPAGSAPSRSRSFASARTTASPRAGSRASPRRSRRSTTSSPSSRGSSAPRRPTASASAPRRGAASPPSRGCSGVPAQIHSDYTFTAMVGVFGPFVAWAASLAMRRLAASADPPSRPRHARRAAPDRRRRPARPRRPGAAQLDRGRLGRADLVPARRHRRRQPGRAAAHRRHLPLRQLRHDVAARQHRVPGALPQRRPARREGAVAERRAVSLLDCAIAASLAVVPVLLGVIALVAWVRPGDPESIWQQGRSDRYVSVRHVAALQTFERAIVAPLVARAAARDDERGARRPRAVPARMERRGRREAVAASLRARRRRRRTAGGAGRRAAGRARRRAARLRRPRQRSRRAPRRRRSRALVRCRRRRARDAARVDRRARAALPGSLRRPGRRAAALRRADAAMLDSFAWRGSEGAATLARWRPEQEVRITAREVTRQESLGRHRRLHLPRPRRRQRFARLLPRRRAQRAAARLRDARGRSRRDRGERRSAGACAGAGGASRRAGAAPIAVDDPRWMVPPSLLALLQPLETLRQPSGALYRAYAEGDERPAACGGARERVAQPRRPRRRAGRLRLFDRRHDRSGAAGARAEDRRLLHRPPRRLPRAGDAPRRGRRPAARRAAARRRDGADGGDRRDRRRQRPHRGARRRALAVRAPGGRRPRPRRRLRHAPALSGAVPRRCAAQSGRLPRRHAGLDDQADHGRRLPRRRRRPRRAPARERARRDAEGRHAGARQPARPADAIRLGALPRPHVLHRAGLRRLRAAVGGAGDGARLRLERRLRRRRRRAAARPTCCSADRSAATTIAPRSRRARPRSPTAACSASRRAGSSAHRCA